MFDAKVVMQIHDEVIIETKADILKNVAAIVKQCMANVNENFSIPLDVKISAGPSWGALKEIS